MDYRSYLDYVEENKSHVPEILDSIPSSLKKFLDKEFGDDMKISDIFLILFHYMFTMQEQIDELYERTYKLEEACEF